MASILKFGVLAILAFCLIGCASGSPDRTYANLNDAFIATIEAVPGAYAAGHISQDAWEETVIPTINAVNALLDEYERRLLLGEPTESVAGEIRGLLLVLQPFLLGSNE